MDDDLVRYEPPVRVWLVSPKSDARFYSVYEDEAQARRDVEDSASGMRMAGPYVLAGRSGSTGDEG